VDGRRPAKNEILNRNPRKGLKFMDYEVASTCENTSHSFNTFLIKLSHTSGMNSNRFQKRLGRK